MSPTFRKVALIVAVLGFALSVLVAACAGDDDEASPPTTTTAATTTEVTTAPTTTGTTTETETETTTTETTTETGTTTQEDPVRRITVTVEGGRPVGGIARPKVKRGDDVVLLVRSDVIDHVHLHGYDLMADAGPGKTARIAFEADIPGRFEIELEERGIQIADLTVNP